MFVIIVTIIFDAIMFFALYYISRLYGGKEVLSFKADTPDDKEFINSAFRTYLLWAAVQQALVVTLFLLLKKVLPVEVDIMICGIIFMSLHFPNIILMFAVLGMEIFLLTGLSVVGWVYIPFMILTHSVLASALLQFFPSDFTKGFKVLWMFYKSYVNTAPPIKQPVKMAKRIK